MNSDGSLSNAYEMPGSTSGSGALSTASTRSDLRGQAPTDDYSPYIPSQTEPVRRITLQQTRPGQKEFRKALLRRDKGCVITGCRSRAMIDAAHIKPLKLCTSGEYHDLDNGLLLRADLHKAFDRGLFTINDDGSLRVRFGATDLPRGVILHALTPGQREYLKGHRKWFATRKPLHHA